MTKWQYQVVMWDLDYDGAGGIKRQLSELGEKGWELVNTIQREGAQTCLIFKRKKVQSTSGQTR